MRSENDISPIGLVDSRATPWLLAIAIGTLAVALRATGLADFFTVDEALFWVGRVNRFGAALAAQDWAGTWLTEHPGVTTLWLGLAGQHLATWLGARAWYNEIVPSVEYLGLLRLPIALVNGIVVGVSYPVLRHLVSPATALLAALLWACSPFLIAFDRLLHVDALSASFATLSVLLLMVDGRWSLLGAGVCLGLALLSKLVALVLLPWAALALLAAALGAGPEGVPQHERWRRALSGATRRYLLWLGIGVLTCFALWPALWADPPGAIRAALFESFQNGSEPHPIGNFFLGRPVADPGWGFYPLILLYRATPLLLVGLAAIPLALARPAPERRALLGLLGWALLFAIAISAAAKKFDRYLLPAWPALTILGAAGLVALGRYAVLLATRLGTRADLVRRGLALAVVLLLVVDRAAASTPMSYYNPLLGGGAAAEQTLLIGWGEGMEEVGAWLSARPDLGHGVVLTWLDAVLAPFVPLATQLEPLSAEVLAREDPPANYAVLYVRGVQRQESADIQAIIRQTPPLYTLQRDGITYATVHQLPRPYTTPIGTIFGKRLTLRGFSIVQGKGTLTVKPSWDVLQDQEGGSFVFVHVLAPDGARVAQVDAPIDEGLFPLWQAGQQFGSPLPISLPAGLAPGTYQIISGVYTPATGGTRLTPDGRALPAALDGPGAILLTTLELP